MNPELRGHLMFNRNESLWVANSESQRLEFTCCKVSRRLPSQRPSHWCESRPSRPAGCWSRSGSHRGWSSSGGTWGRRSTASPGHEASRLGRSCRPWRPEETPPDRHTKGKDDCLSQERFTGTQLPSLSCTWHIYVNKGSIFHLTDNNLIQTFHHFIRN